MQDMQGFIESRPAKWEGIIVQKATSQPIINGAATKITWDILSQDIDGRNHDIVYTKSNSTIYVPEDVTLIRVHGQVYINITTSYKSLYTRVLATSPVFAIKNDILVAHTAAVTNTTKLQLNRLCTIIPDAHPYVECVAEQFSGSSQNIQPCTQLSNGSDERENVYQFDGTWLIIEVLQRKRIFAAPSYHE